MKVPMFSLAVLMVAIGARADHGFAIIPSLEVTEVSDDNLNFTADEPLRDRIRRVSPSLGLRFDSPRLRVTGGYSIDSERYANHSTFDSDLARARAAMGIDYQAGPRLNLSMQSTYVDTNTLADLNVTTGLAGSRLRGRRLSFEPSAAFRVSPRLTAKIGASSMTTNVIRGVGMRGQNQTLDLAQRVTPRDLFSVGYAHSHLLFSGASSQTIEGHTLLAGWTHDLGAHDQLILQAGPRMTNHVRSADVAASVTHKWRISSIGLSFLRNQATVIGYAGALDTQNLQARFTVAPNRRLTAYAEPAVIRSSDHQFQATVYRLSLGARYAISSLFDAAVAYNKDTQNGAIDPLRPDANLSRATLSFGFAARWNNPERTR
jgi:hypothetical protein